MPSNHLILCHHLLFLPSIFPSIRVFSKESVLHIRWPKYCSPWNSPGQNTGVGSPSLLQEIFPTQVFNLWHCRQILYQLSQKGSPRILEWVQPIPSPVDLLDPGMELGSPALQVDSLPTEGSPIIIYKHLNILLSNIKTYVYLLIFAIWIKILFSQ